MPKTVAEGHKLYAVCMRDNAYYLVGPFDSYGALRVWGDVERDNGDDPRWQSIELPGHALMPDVHGPDWHPSSTP